MEEAVSTENDSLYSDTPPSPSLPEEAPNESVYSDTGDSSDNEFEDSDSSVNEIEETYDELLDQLSKRWL